MTNRRRRFPKGSGVAASPEAIGDRIHAWLTRIVTIGVASNPRKITVQNPHTSKPDRPIMIQDATNTPPFSVITRRVGMVQDLAADVPSLPDTASGRRTKRKLRCKKYFIALKMTRSVSPRTVERRLFSL